MSVAGANSSKDLFIFNFPFDFVPKSIEERYYDFLKDYNKPFESIKDYLNSCIKDIQLPSLTFPTVEQTKTQGLQIFYRGSVSPYNIYQRDLTITVDNMDDNMSYMIFQDVLMDFYLQGCQPHYKQFMVTTLDYNRREHFQMVFSEVIPTSQSNFDFSYATKDNSERSFTLGFKYNYLDIEYMPKRSIGQTDVELIEKFSDAIIPNDDRNLDSPPLVE